MQSGTRGQAIEHFKTFRLAEKCQAAYCSARHQPCRFSENLLPTHLCAARDAKESPQGFALRYNSYMPSVSQTIRVKVLFFGRLKDVVGQSEESLDLTEAPTIEQLFADYAARMPELAKYRSSVVASRNQEFASWDTPLHSGDEVAFLPPVSGG